jgi:hypothetical protein
VLLAPGLPAAAAVPSDAGTDVPLAQETLLHHTRSAALHTRQHEVGHRATAQHVMIETVAATG